MPRNLFLCLDAYNDPLESHLYYMSFKKIKLRSETKFLVSLEDIVGGENRSFFFIHLFLLVGG